MSDECVGAGGGTSAIRGSIGAEDVQREIPRYKLAAVGVPYKSAAEVRQGLTRSCCRMTPEEFSAVRDMGIAHKPQTWFNQSTRPSSALYEELGAAGNSQCAFARQ